MALTVNTIEGASFQETNTPDGIVASATRIAIVDGMSGDPATALIRAYAIVAAQYPYGLIYNSLRPTCILTGYGAAGFVEDSAAVRIELKYSTPSPIKPNGTVWTVEDDGYIQQTTTQLDPVTHKPIRVVYDPTQANGAAGGPTQTIQVFNAAMRPTTSIKIDRIATLSYPEPVRRVILSGILHKNLVPPLRENVGTVNENDWSGFERGHWRFTRLNSKGVVFTPYRQVTIELDGLEEIDWSVFSILQDRHDNEFKCDDDLAKTLRETPYGFGVIPTGANNKGGVVRAGFYDVEDFSALFGIDDVDEL